MVCPRCIEAVKRIFQRVELSIIDINLGNVTIPEKITTIQKQKLKEHLIQGGFELLNDKQAQLINKIKSIIIQEVHYNKEPAPTNFSTLLAENLHYDYTSLSRLFSSVEGKTIEKFVIVQKIEKIKEFLTYGELNLSEIAFQMNYSSSSHLSTQFKNITGMTPTAFRQLHHQERKSLDEL